MKDNRGKSRKIPIILALAILSNVYIFAVEESEHSTQSDNSNRMFSTEEIVRRILPSVAHVTAERKQKDEFSEHTLSTRSGTGFLIDSEGHILTNYHVVDGAHRIVVSFQGVSRRKAQLIGTDPVLDVALLRIHPTPEGIDPAVVSDREKVLLGEEVIVAGHPFTLHNTITMGVISGLKRPISPNGMDSVMEVFQFDAALNPGNSGGPVLDRSGEVIGIATAMYPDAHGIGFAVPIQKVQPILPDLKNYGHARRIWVGVMGTIIDEDLSQLFNLPLKSGFLVESIHKGSPADKAGIRGGQRIVPFAGHLVLLGGDIIQSIDGTPVDDVFDLGEILTNHSEHELISLDLFREGKRMTVTLRLNITPDGLIAVPAEAHP
jgi:S1-C subfamily serine protease